MKNMKELRKFGIILGIILAAVGLLQLLRGQTEIYLWFFGASVLILFLSLFFPLVLKPLFIIFTRVGKLIGWVNTRIFLSLIFYGLFTPISLILKLFRKDFLDRRIKKSAETYWLVKEKVKVDRSDFEKQF